MSSAVGSVAEHTLGQHSPTSWRGALPAATGRKMHFTGTTVLRLENGKIAEEIGLDGGVTALTQLGLIKATLNSGADCWCRTSVVRKAAGIVAMELSRDIGENHFAPQFGRAKMNP